MQLPELSLVTRQDYLRALELIVKDQRASRWYIQKHAKVGYPKALELVSAFLAAGYITEQDNGRFTVHATWTDVDTLTEAFRVADETEEAEDRAKQALWDARDDKGVLIKEHRRSPAFKNQMPFSEEAFSEILERVGKGETLAGILGDGAHLPSLARWTVWLEDHPNADLHRRRYFLARLARADLLAQQVVDIASDSSDDTRIIQLPGSVQSVVTDTQHIARTKLRVETIKWFLAKVWPDYFGENIDVNREREQLLRSDTPAIDMSQLTDAARVKLTVFLEQVEADKTDGWMAT